MTKEEIEIILSEIESKHTDTVFSIAYYSEEPLWCSLMFNNTVELLRVKDALIERDIKVSGNGYFTGLLIDLDNI